MDQTSKASVVDVENELLSFFRGLKAKAEAMGWERDSSWTRGINTHVAAMGLQRKFKVYTNRCDCEVDGPEWLYDHHWRMVNLRDELIRIPLAMEIEWGFGHKTIRQKITEDYLKLVQSRADLKIMVFQCSEAEEMVEYLVKMAGAFEDKGPEDRFIFAAYDWDKHEMYCRAVSA